MNIKVVDKGTGDTGREMGNQGKPITNRGHGSCNRCVKKPRDVVLHWIQDKLVERETT